MRVISSQVMLMKYTLLIYHQLKCGYLYKSRICSVNAPEKQVSAMISVKLFLLPIYMERVIRPQSEVCHYTVRKIIYKCKTFKTTVGDNMRGSSSKFTSRSKCLAIMHSIIFVENRTQFHPKHLIRSVKHSGGGLIIWACLVATDSDWGHATGKWPQARQQLCNRMAEKKRSPDLNLIETLWRDLKRTVHKRMSWSNVEKQSGPEILHNKWKMITSGCCC